MSFVDLLEPQRASPMVPVVKNPIANTGDAIDVGSIPRLGRFLGERNGNALQYSCLESPMDRGAWPATAHGFARGWIGLSD